MVFRQPQRQRRGLLSAWEPVMGEQSEPDFRGASGDLSSGLSFSREMGQVVMLRRSPGLAEELQFLKGGAG